MSGVQVTALSITFGVWVICLFVSLWGVRYYQQRTSVRDAVLEAIRRGDLSPMTFCFKLDNSHIEFDGERFVESRCDCWRLDYQSPSWRDGKKDSFDDNRPPLQ